MEYVDKWWAVLLPLIRPQLYINGGKEVLKSHQKFPFNRFFAEIVFETMTNILNSNDKDHKEYKDMSVVHVLKFIYFERPQKVTSKLRGRLREILAAFWENLNIKSLLRLSRTSLYWGNIIMVQLENEYGSYGLQTSYCDVRYMKHLHDLVRQHLGIKSLKVKFKSSVDHTTNPLFLKRKLDYICW